tara:strand:+ start:2277 stop:3461 length:1185 start_codon:yes stop_codon:yes gene_type:complete
MVKYKNQLIKLQFLFLFLIPLTPHFEILNNLQLDDIPVLLFLILFTVNIFLNSIQKFYFKEVFPLIIFIVYITIQNYIINNSLFFSDNIRYIFYLVVIVSLLNLKDTNFTDNYFIFLALSLSIFSILFFFLEINLGTDSYDYWKIGFNQNEWMFTNGRMNGFQAGGPNAFGGLIAVLIIYCFTLNLWNSRYFMIFIGILGCFFTYSRAALIVLIFFLLFLTIFKKDIKGVLIIIITLVITLNYGLIDRFSSETETEGIGDRIQMQQASINDISSRSINQNIFGYGYGNFGIVRDEIKPIAEFSSNVRPTGPHNSFIFLILDYGIFGFLIFLYIFASSFLFFLKDIKLNIFEPEYLFIGAFVGLSLSGDFIQNHSISILFFLILGKLYSRNVYDH